MTKMLKKLIGFVFAMVLCLVASIALRLTCDAVNLPFIGYFTLLTVINIVLMIRKNSKGE